ncbi:TIGR02221 family CRISPR-associated protein, partial [Desulfurobacterium sp.]
VDNVRFIQEAIVRMLEWKEGDKITIFVTDEALKKNWEDNGQGNGKEGLGTRLNKLKEEGLKADFSYITIPEGKSEKELWEIFEKVLNIIQPKEDIIFDITHSFRSLPLLAAVLLNYAKVLKKINLKGVYYGAFDVLGSSRQVENIPIEERNAPIFDLTAFFTLYDWTIAIDNFLKFGDVESLESLTKDRINPILSRTKGQDRVAKNLKKFVENLKKIADGIKTNRGKEILDFDSEKIMQLMKNEEKNFIKPLTPVFLKVEEKISGFEKGNIRNGYKAVEWCIKHGLIQQGYTILQETIITDIIVNILKDDYSNLDVRELVAKAFRIKGQNIPEDKWIVKDEYRENLKEIVSLIPEDFVPVFNRLTDFRNDINHAGFVNPRKSDDLRRKLEKIFMEIEKMVL